MIYILDAGITQQNALAYSGVRAAGPPKAHRLTERRNNVSA
jgi:hypothetical protein